MGRTPIYTTTNLQTLLPVTQPRHLDQFLNPDDFAFTDPGETIAFSPHRAWVVASGSKDEESYFAVSVVHPTACYLVLVYASPECDWTLHDKAFYTDAKRGTEGLDPFGYLLNRFDPAELLAVFLTE